jgi:hypothetical protein
MFAELMNRTEEILPETEGSTSFTLPCEAPRVEFKFSIRTIKLLYGGISHRPGTGVNCATFLLPSNLQA